MNLYVCVSSSSRNSITNALWLGHLGKRRDKVGVHFGLTLEVTRKVSASKLSLEVVDESLLDVQDKREEANIRNDCLWVRRAHMSFIEQMLDLRAAGSGVDNGLEPVVVFFGMVVIIVQVLHGESLWILW